MTDSPTEFVVLTFPSSPVSENVCVFGELEAEAAWLGGVQHGNPHVEGKPQFWGPQGRSDYVEGLRAHLFHALFS